MQNQTNANAKQATHWLAGGGEMGEQICAFDWSTSRLGPIDQWPEALVSTLGICLSARFPMAIYWEREGFLFYNDAWRPILGDKHPWALGQPARAVWPEIWDAIAPLLTSVLTTGEATWRSDELLLMQRFGYTEECYFDYTFNPIRGRSGKVEGILNVVLETTERVVRERQLKTLRDLGERGLAEAKNAAQACHAAAETLAENSRDIPFALLYLLEREGQRARLVEAVGLAADTAAAPACIPIYGEADVWQFGGALAINKIQVVENLAEQFGQLPAGAWADDCTRRAVVAPLAKAGVQELPAGFLVAGVSPRLPFNEEYRGFFELVAGHIGTAIANAQAYEEECQRAEALAEIDRAKTAFFSNVSHEFRTPLTLMLGPLEDALTEDDLPAETRERLSVAHRNSQRLLKLVNTLLDFSRLEAGRLEAVYEPVDLAAYTAELASVFRSAVERAGMTLVVDCPPLNQPVYVDREMWEKIVLNLLSNAFKFTFAGEIEVKLRIADCGWRIEEKEEEKEEEETTRQKAEGARQESAIRHPQSAIEKSAILTVRDTGTGIPAEEMPHLFERFHRVKGARGRSYEGSGIGLALVQELVNLHGGTVRVESEPDKGSTFTVSLPSGFAHLPADRIGDARAIAATATNATAFVNEAWRWLLDGGGRGTVDSGRLEAGKSFHEQFTRHPPPTTNHRSRILLADDNADMREYVQRLLSAAYEVEAVADGERALAAARRRPPDLILTDVMMPRLDGFGLLQALRADERLQNTPVLLLSARAGEESRVEGLQAGADDYLVKPFTARELLARVESHLKLRQMRREAEAARAESQAILASIRDAFSAFDRDWRYTYINERGLELTGRRREEFMGRTVWEVFPDLLGTEFETQLRQAMEQRRTATFESYYAPWQRWLENRVYPTADGLSLFTTDISKRKQAEAAMQQAWAELQATYDQSPVGMLQLDADLRYVRINEALAAMNGIPAAQHIGKTIHEVVPNLTPKIEADFRRVMNTGEPVLDIELTGETEAEPGVEHTWLESWFPMRDASGKVTGLNVVAQDITERKRREANLTFFSEIAEILSNTADEAEMMQQVGAKIGAFLNLASCLFTEADLQHNETRVPYGWFGAEMPNLVGGVYRHVDFVTDEFHRATLAGEMVVVADTSNDARIADPAAHQALKIHSFVTVPFFRDGVWKFLLVVTDSQPRPWRKDEIELIRELAHRIFPRLERARAEHAVRASEKQLRVVTNAMPALISYIDADFRYRFVNQTYTDWFGYQSEQMIGKTMAEVLGVAAFENLRPHVESALRGTVEIFEAETPYQTGGARAIRAVYTPDLAANGAVKGIFVLVLDITERKRAEDQLRASEERYRALVEAASQVVWVMDAEESSDQQSHWFSQLTGKAMAEIKGQDYLDFIHPDDRDYLQQVARSVVQKPRPYEIEFRLQPAGEDYHYYNLRGVPLFDEHGVLREWIGTVKDITETKLAQRALRASEERLRLALESAQIGIHVWQITTNTVMWDGRVRELWGLAPEDEVNYEVFLNGLHPDDRGSLQDAVDRALDPQSDGRYCAEYRVIGKYDQQLRWVSATGQVHFERGAPIHCIGTARDITESKQLAAERERLLAEEQRAREAAEAATRAKDEFLAVVSHELRSPLNAMLGYARILRMQRRSDAEVGKATEVIERNGRAQLQLIEDLMDTARIVSGKLKLEIAPLELTEVIAAALDTLRPAAESKRIALEVAFDSASQPHVYPLLGDAARLQQVVWNLLSNALKFTPTEGRVRVALSRSDTAAQIVISDTGKGIKAELLPYIFDRFKQGDSSSTRRFGGLGLGLALAKHLVELHGGQVEVQSAGEGLGATFTVTLPMRESGGEEPHLLLVSEAHQSSTTFASDFLQGLRVLVVDDEDEAREVVTHTLQAYGAFVAMAESAATGFVLLETAAPNRYFDLLVSDIGMPGEDGYELLRKVRHHADPRVRTIRAIALTAYARAEDRLKALQAGFQMHVPKPVEEVELVMVAGSLTGRLAQK